MDTRSSRCTAGSKLCCTFALFGGKSPVPLSIYKKYWGIMHCMILVRRDLNEPNGGSRLAMIGHVPATGMLRIQLDPFNYD